MHIKQWTFSQKEDAKMCDKNNDAERKNDLIKLITDIRSYQHNQHNYKENYSWLALAFYVGLIFSIDFPKGLSPILIALFILGVFMLVIICYQTCQKEDAARIIAACNYFHTILVNEGFKKKNCKNCDFEKNDWNPYEISDGECLSDVSMAKKIIQKKNDFEKVKPKGCCSRFKRSFRRHIQFILVVLCIVFLISFCFMDKDAESPKEIKIISSYSICPRSPCKSK